MRRAPSYEKHAKQCIQFVWILQYANRIMGTLISRIVHLTHYAHWTNSGRTRHLHILIQSNHWVRKTDAFKTL